MPSFTRLSTLAFVLITTSCHPNTRTSAKSDAGAAPSGSVAPAEASDSHLCRSVANTAIPAGHEPNADERSELGSCDSEALYYGIGRPADFVRARKCAYVERDGKSPPPLGGAVILMMIYANGK